MNTKKMVVSLAGLLLFLAMTSVAAHAQSSYSGTVTASQIASTGGSSGLGIWMKKLNCHNEADCSRVLVRAGGKYVLVTSKGVYQLSDQSKAALFAGNQVTVNGDLNNKQKTIEVANMELSNSTATSAAAQ